MRDITGVDPEHFPSTLVGSGPLRSQSVYILNDFLAPFRDLKEYNVRIDEEDFLASWNGERRTAKGLNGHAFPRKCLTVNVQEITQPDILRERKNELAIRRRQIVGASIANLNWKLRM